MGRAEVHGYRVEQGRHSEAHLVGVRVTVRVSVRARVGDRARVPAKARLGQGYAYGWGCAAWVVNQHRWRVWHGGRHQREGGWARRVLS